MNSVNSSTGFSGFQLRSGFSPRIIPPLIPSLPSDSPPADFDAHGFLQQIQLDVLEAQDSLLSAKISQAHAHNRERRPDPDLKSGDKVLLRTLHWKNEYKRKGDK
ncbi:hypothetical protein GYMLUDRAFT_183290 [Collybiopsis luxurians FD-317 M1]|uniref:Uncharacterized protein n=1 Tax=Collybiopsis luxurians FD-317 M1 TaxID=944289 RepID=A0A0D0B7J3_9AGAR|nr:hypothetical protein GYMLUDRAFT_183290 [Collybiopsis luxurians FD-317 M1]